jgi:aspartyl-tRNA synthetase
MPEMKRTHYCGELRLSDVGKTVQLTGWVARRRDHGGVIFVDIRDRTGITQVVFDPNIDIGAHKIANQIRSEFVLVVSGTVRERLESDLLFSLELAHETELKAQHFSEELRQAFKENEHPLSQNVEILGRETDGKWLITDKTSKRTYVIKLTETEIRVYLGTINPNLPTGEIELATNKLEILNVAKTPPFLVEDDINSDEEIRMTYRYIDLRRPKMQKTLAVRHKAMLSARKYMDEQGFLEIETPILMNSTPEGARDVLVPSRLNAGKFYALPQSPQQFKQLLMMSGVDRYFQIPRCFRDEDTRADRQLEFTQLDLEMSFATVDDVLEVTEGLMKRMFEEAAGIPVPTPFPRISYHDSMARFGNDKPDTRFGMELSDLSDLVADCDFKVFTGALERKGRVKGIAVPGGAVFSRKEIENLTEFVAIYKARGLAWIKVTEKGFESSIVKFFSEETLKAVAERMGAKPGDIMMFVADKPKIVADALSNLRLRLGRQLGLIDESRFDFLWIVDYPLFDWNEDENRYEPFHHVFTAPSEESVPLLDTDPGGALSQHYDLVINGIEICSGSVRIHRWDIQQKVLELLKIGPEEVERRYGYFIKALQHGTPPHAGIAPGLDRIVMLMTGEDNIREVIAFPKTQNGLCLLTGAPSEVTDGQLADLSIKVDL